MNQTHVHKFEFATDAGFPNYVASGTVVGNVKDQFSLDATHILTIGRDATATGQAQGLQLQIFDVADGRNPILAHKFTYTGSEYGSSEAEQNHKAFTYFADRKMLAFPYYAYTATTVGGMRSSLELFNVDTAAGFAKLGSIDHTELVSKYPAGYCGGYYGPEVRRGVFLDNFVFSISYGGIVAKEVTNLAAVGTKLPLAAPQVNTGYGPACVDAAF
jgi:hypothetical protein